jgi:hypothetical protein
MNNKHSSYPYKWLIRYILNIENYNNISSISVTNNIPTSDPDQNKFANLSFLRVHQFDGFPVPAGDSCCIGMDGDADEVLLVGQLILFENSLNHAADLMENLKYQSVTCRE